MSEQWGGGYGPPGPPPGGYGGYGPPADPNVKNIAVAALVCNIFAAVMCCGVASVAGVICAAIALSKADLEPESAKKLNLWAWITLGATFVIDIILVLCVYIFPFAFLSFADSSY